MCCCSLVYRILCQTGQAAHQVQGSPFSGAPRTVDSGHGRGENGGRVVWQLCTESWEAPFGPRVHGTNGEAGPEDNGLSVLRD